MEKADLLKLIENNPDLKEEILERFSVEKITEQLKTELTSAKAELEKTKTSLAEAVAGRDDYKARFENANTELAAYKAKEAKALRETFIQKVLEENKLDRGKIFNDVLEMWQNMESEEKITESIKKYAAHLNKNVDVRPGIPSHKNSIPGSSENPPIDFINMPIDELEKHLTK